MEMRQNERELRTVVDPLILSAYKIYLLQAHNGNVQNIFGE